LETHCHSCEACPCRVPIGWQWWRQSCGARGDPFGTQHHATFLPSSLTQNESSGILHLAEGRWRVVIQWDMCVCALSWLKHCLLQLTGLPHLVVNRACGVCVARTLDRSGRMAPDHARGQIRFGSTKASKTYLSLVVLSQTVNRTRAVESAIR